MTRWSQFTDIKDARLELKTDLACAFGIPLLLFQVSSGPGDESPGPERVILVYIGVSSWFSGSVIEVPQMLNPLPRLRSLFCTTPYFNKTSDTSLAVLAFASSIPTSKVTRYLDFTDTAKVGRSLHKGLTLARLTDL